MQSNSPTKLTPSQQKLIEMMSSIHFGRIERFPVRDGEPILDPKPVIVIQDKPGTRPEACSPYKGSHLRSEFQDILYGIKSLGNGTVHSIQIRHGLPFLMEKIPAD